MNDALQKMIGRLLILLLFVSPVFIINNYRDYYEAKTVNHIAEEYLLDIQDNTASQNINLDNFSTFSLSIATYGYSCELSIEGVEDGATLSYEDFQRKIELDEDITLHYLDKITLKLYSNDHIFYKCAVAYGRKS